LLARYEEEFRNMTAIDFKKIRPFFSGDAVGNILNTIKTASFCKRAGLKTDGVKISHGAIVDFGKDIHINNRGKLTIGFPVPGPRSNICDKTVFTMGDNAALLVRHKFIINANNIVQIREGGCA
jgi:hypothetical protein